MSGSLKVGGSELINDNGGSGSLQWGSGVPSGSIVQVQYTQYTGSAAMSGLSVNIDYSIKDGNANTGTEILTVQLTPRISNSKFIIEAQWMGELVDSQMTWNSTFLFLRGSTRLGNSNTGNNAGIQVPWFTHPNDSLDDGSTGNGVYLKYFDAPNISAGTATTWKLAFNQADDSSNQVVYTNQTADAEAGPNNTGMERGISFISVTELAP